MSIIYEALKKVSAAQNHNSGIASGNKTAVSGKDKLKLILLCILIVSFGFFFADVFFSIFMNPKPVSTDLAKASGVHKDKPVLVESPSVPVLAVTEKTTSPAKESTVAADTSSLEPFPAEEKLVLSGVFFSQEQGYALINGQIVRVGDTISGALVKGISLDGVTLEVQGKIIELHQ